MNFSIKGLFYFFVLLLSFPLHAEPTGKEIMEEQNKRHGTVTEKTEQLVLLVDKNGNKEQRSLLWYTKEIADKEYRFLIVFTEPAAIKGTSLLTWNHKKGESDQWIFLPEQKRLQRIAAGSKKGYFMGTDFTYEDIDQEDIDNFSFTIIKEEVYMDKPCWIIESVPVSDRIAKSSGYSKRHIWIQKDIYFIVKIDFYDKNNELLKTQTNHDLKQIKGSLWRCDKALMQNHKSGHKTLMAIKTRDINNDIDSKIFTERYILSGRHTGQ